MSYGGVSYAGGSYAGQGVDAGAAGDFPSVSAEIAFESDPLDETPVWTDVTAYLRNFDVTRGRQRELDRYQTGRMMLTLDNRDRRFDSEYGTNLLTPQEASMEDGITGWGNTVNCAIARTTAQASEGSSSLQMTATAAGDMSAETGRRAPVLPGRRYLAIADYRAASTVQFCNTSIRFWTVDGDEVAGIDETGELDASTQDTTSSWTLDASVQMIAPDTAAFASVVVTVESADAGGEVHYVDAVALYRDSTSTVFTDPPPYGAGRIEPRKRVRLRATYAGVTYPIFDGFIDVWEDQYDHPNDAWVLAQCSDGLKTLQQADLATSAYAQEVLADEPVAWWRLDEGGGTVAYDSVGSVDLTATGSPTLGQTTLIARDPGASASFAANTDGFVREGELPITGGPLTVEFVVDSTDGSGTIVGNVAFAGNAGFAVDHAEAIGFQIAVPSVGSANIASSVAYDDGAVHHVAGVWAADGSLKIYVDGVDTSSGSASVTSGTFGAEIGWTLICASPFDAGIVGNVDEVAFYNKALSAERIAAHAAAVTVPWNGDTPKQRIERVLDVIEWPDNLRELDTGKSTLQSATLNMSVLAHAEKVRDSEFGELYVARDGTVRFEGREAGINQPTYETFGDGAGELDYVAIEYDHSDQLIRNDVTISRNEGSAQNQEDPVSIRRFQRHSYTSDGLIHDDDETSRYAAQYLVSEYAYPLKRVTQLVIKPRDTPSTMFPSVLGRELTDRVQVVRRPQGVGSAISQTVRIEGIRHSGAPKEWETTWQLSPAFADENRGAFWQLGVAGFSELGETTRLFFNLGTLGLPLFLASTPFAGALSHASDAHAVTPLGDIGVVLAVGVTLGAMGLRSLRRRHVAAPVLDPVALQAGSATSLRGRVVRMAKRAMRLAGINTGRPVASTHVLGVRDRL